MYSSITISSKKSVDEIVDRLKNAWVQLRFEAPIIAVKVEPSPDLGQQYHQFVYQIQKGEGIQAWLKTSFHILPPMTKEEAHDQIISERAKLAYGQFSGNLYFVPLLAESNVYRLVFATPHATTDVRGSMSVSEALSIRFWRRGLVKLH